MDHSLVYLHLFDTHKQMATSFYQYGGLLSDVQGKTRIKMDRFQEIKVSR